jgi:predicted amidohydrolase YtcJ
MTRRLVFLSIAVACAAWHWPGRAHAHPGADVIYFNGRIETLDASFHRAQALAIRHGRILDVGGNLEVLLRHARLGTRLVDLHRRTVLPGFVDAHTHLFNDAAGAGKTLAEMQDVALAEGITSLGDLYVNAAFLPEMQAFAAAGELKVRTSLYLVADSACGLLLGDWWKSVPPNRDPEAMLRIPGIKIFTDGGSCGLAATTFPLHLDDPDAPVYGDLFLSQDIVDGLVLEANTLGYQVAMHSIGDRSRDVAMHAIANALGGSPNVLRHRIEHNSMVRPDQLAFYVAHGIVPVGWGYQSTCGQNAGNSYFNQLPPGDEGWWSPWKTMLAAGLPLAWHMDWYYAVPLELIDTRLHLWWLVTRRGIDTDGTMCEPQPAVAAERVSVRQALRMMTLSSAYALHMEEAVGSLEADKLADLVILDRDPLEVAEDDLKDLNILSTVVGGVPRVCAPSAADLCF